MPEMEGMVLFRWIRCLWTVIAVLISLTQIVSGRSCLIVASGVGSTTGAQLSTVCPGTSDPGVASVSRLPLEVRHTPKDVTYMDSTEQVVWSEYDNTSSYSAIYRGPLDGGAINKVIEVPSGSHIEGVAADEGGGWVYYTDVGRLVVGRVSLDGGTSKDLITSDLRKPRDIALHLGTNFMFWTDWGNLPEIERADLLGANRKNVARGNMICPNGLTIDLVESKLYWCDCRLKTIEVSDLDGTNRQVVSQDTTETDIKYYSIALDSQFIYLADWQSKYIRRMDKTTTAIENWGFVSDGKLYGMIVADIPNIETSSRPRPTTVKRLTTVQPTDKITSTTSSTENEGSGTDSFTTYTLTQALPVTNDSVERKAPVSGTGLTGGMLIAVIVISVVIPLAALAALVGICLYRRRRERMPSSDDDYEVPTTTEMDSGSNNDTYTHLHVGLYEEIRPVEGRTYDNATPSG